MTRSAALAGVLLAVLLAGCAAPAEEDAPPAGDVAQKALLERALREMPSPFSARMRATTSNGTELTIEGTFDRARNTTYVELGGDGHTLATIGGSAGAGTYLEHGLVFYVSPQGIVYFANGTAFVQPPDDPETRRVGTVLPTPEHGPLGVLLRADALVLDLAAPDVRVVGANATTWEGEEAVELALERDGRASNVVVTRAEPPRLVRVSTRIAPDPQRPPSALDDAALVGTLHYDEASIRAPGDEATRALALVYVSKRAGPEITWTFVGQGGIDLRDLEVQVKRSTGNVTVGDPSLLPTQWSFPPSQGSRSMGNLTLAYRDADADGALTRGDTLVATLSGGGAFPPLVLYDLVTGTRVVPGAGLAVAATALLLAALAGRRR